MSIFNNPIHLKKLQDLLAPSKENDNDSSDSENDSHEKTTNFKNYGPGQIDDKKVLPNSSKEINKLKPKISTVLSIDNNEEGETDIEKWLEKQQKDDFEALDTRERPEYKITYKQAIGTEDCYLQLSNRSPASMSCEDIVINIEMPKETVSVEDMSLIITEDEIELKSPIYRLKLPLIHKINPDKGNAKYDSEKKLLTLTLRMKREYDFAHF